MTKSKTTKKAPRIIRLVPASAYPATLNTAPQYRGCRIFWVNCGAARHPMLLTAEAADIIAAAAPRRAAILERHPQCALNVHLMPLGMVTPHGDTYVGSHSCPLDLEVNSIYSPELLHERQRQGCGGGETMWTDRDQLAYGAVEADPEFYRAAWGDSKPSNIVADPRQVLEAL